MSHSYGSSSRGIRAAMGGGGGKNFRNLFPAVQSGKKGALPKLLTQNPNPDAGSDKSDSSGLDVGVCTVQGRRPYQEDQYAVCRFLKDPQGNNENTPETHYFGVFDGHAGGKCSKAICSTIPYQFCRDEAFNTKLPLALKRAIQKTNEQFLEVAGRMRLNDGSTAVQIAIRGRTMTIANVGDSRAVLISGRKAITLTEDHKPSAPAEHRRIASFGGTVTYNTGIARVAGVLAVSRAFGNYTIRNLIRADPDVTQRELTEQDHYLVLASDGLWDVFRAAEVADICYTYERHGVQRIADYLVQMSLTRGSMDNITAVVVSLSRYHARMAQMEAGGANSNGNAMSMSDSKQLPSNMKEKVSTGLFNNSTANMNSHSQRPASSGGPTAGMNDNDRQHARHGKTRPSSGYAALNTNANFSNRQKSTTSSDMYNTPSGPTQSEIFEVEEETLHDELSEFNKSVDYSALRDHVNGVKQNGGGHSHHGSRMHQRMRGHGDHSNSRAVSSRPRSSQHMKQSNDTSSVSNGLFGDRNRNSNDGRQHASPSNIMKRMFSRGKGQDSNKQPAFSNIGDENLGNGQSNGQDDGGNSNRPMSGSQGGDQQMHSTGHRRPASGVMTNSQGYHGMGVSSGGIASGGSMRSNRHGGYSRGTKTSPLLAFSGNGDTNSQRHSGGDHPQGLGNDMHSRTGSGSAVDRVQNVGYSRGMHSPINTRHRK